VVWGRHRFHEGDLGRAEDDIGRVGRLSDMCFGLGLSTQVFVLCRRRMSGHRLTAAADLYGWCLLVSAHATR